MDSIFDRLRAVRPFIQRAYDASAWIVGYTSMALLQLAVGYSTAEQVRPALWYGIATGVAFVALAAPLRLHEGRSSVGSFPDAILTSATGAVIAFSALAFHLLSRDPLRISVGVTAPMCVFVLMLGGRAVYRIARDWSTARAIGPNDEREPVVLIGAGTGARQLVLDMERDPACAWRPVALLDDDPYKRHRRISGVRVFGSTDAIEETAERFGADTVILAIPSAPAALVRRFDNRCRAAGLDLKVLPSVNDLSIPTRAQIRDVRDIEVSDFLGRQPIETDVAAIAGYLAGRRVLVTGAGGSIGSELCRQIARYSPSELIMLDRDESALHGVQLSIEGHAMLDGDDVVLGDIRDERFLKEVFRRRRPEVVFHAAALKHLPLLETSPGEAVKTNVWGTQNVLQAAMDAGVERFVNISTDKAANPCSVLGYSKRLAEGLTSAADREADGRFMSVRFGNVLGSRGSVLTTFAAQIARGGPVTVTDPGVTRYFMTVGEAVQLVIQAGAIGADGDVLVLDMGEPVSIVSVAHQLIEMADEPVEISYTGLRHGEKLHEELFGDGEDDWRPFHPLISHTTVPEFASSDMVRLASYGNRDEVVRGLVGASDSMSYSGAMPIPPSRRRGTRWQLAHQRAHLT